MKKIGLNEWQPYLMVLLVLEMFLPWATLKYRLVGIIISYTGFDFHAIFKADEHHAIAAILMFLSYFLLVAGIVSVASYIRRNESQAIGFGLIASVSLLLMVFLPALDVGLGVVRIFNIFTLLLLLVTAVAFLALVIMEKRSGTHNEKRAGS